jgi:DNA (cytosine-5)-methyltransferase 1
MVIGDLAEMGYDCEWCIVSASDCGAPHKRDRFWLVGNTNNYGQTSTKVSASTAQGSSCSETWQEQTSELEGSGQQHEAVADTTSQRLRREQRQEHERGRVRFAYSGEEMADSNLQHGQRRSQSLESISNSKGSWSELNRCNSKVADTDSERQQELHSTAIASKARQHSRRLAKGWRESWWASEPNVGRVADRVAARVDRLKAIGNGQVPIVAATAFRILSGAAVK